MYVAQKFKPIWIYEWWNKVWKIKLEFLYDTKKQNSYVLSKKNVLFFIFIRLESENPEDSQINIYHNASEQLLYILYWCTAIAATV